MSFHMMDVFGQKLIHIKKRSLIALQPSYDFYDAATNQMVMSVTHVFSFGASKFRVEMIGSVSDVQAKGLGQELVIKGSWYEMEYGFYKQDGSMCAQVRKSYWSCEFSIFIVN